ncbi:hypothetical protein E2C01_049421 [Portunus trituberculatus]|uniref:Uncharacterized protein n=1 Tax=Portunus trituberculatus TaxID=210409 RepID=A0A5B7GDX1_PORTR|nr:hypothetical protein [Portunus trituberculatus]
MVCRATVRGPPSLNSNRQACTRWSMTTLLPKVNYTKLRFTQCGGLLYLILGGLKILGLLCLSQLILKCPVQLCHSMTQALHRTWPGIKRAGAFIIQLSNLSEIMSL